MNFLRFWGRHGHPQSPPRSAYESNISNSTSIGLGYQFHIIQKIDHKMATSSVHSIVCVVGTSIGS